MRQAVSDRRSDRAQRERGASRPATLPARRRAAAPRWAIAFCLLALSLVSAPLALASGALAQDAPPPPSATDPHALVLESIVLEGNDRTPLETVLLYLPLCPDQPIDQETLLEAVDELRAGGLFRSVAFYTRPGSARGRLVLVLEVEEHDLDLRFGTGNTDLDGWYLVPVMLALDNRFGRGERMDLELRLGFRHAGVVARYFEPRFGDGRNYWGVRLFGLATDRPYFTAGIEYQHDVGRGGLALVFGRRTTAVWTLEAGLTLQKIDADSTSRAASDVPEQDVGRGDRLPFAELPAGVRSGVGERNQQIVHVDLRLDARGSERVAGAAISGLWGRLKAELVHDEVAGSFPRATADLRAYGRLLGGAVATRLRASWVDTPAAFYDRLYLGGLTTVRGFPTHSLSSPGGDTWLWTGSLEYRAPLIGDGPAPRLAGGLFADIGRSGRRGDRFFDGFAASAGWGLRLRLGFVGWIGFDVGYPLTAGPYDEAFHVNGTIGWSF